MTVDERRIRDALHAYAQPEESRDVTEAGVRFRDRLATDRRQQQRRRRVLIPVAVGLVVIATAVTWRLVTTSPDAASPVDSPEPHLTPGALIDDPCLPPDRVPEIADPVAGEAMGFIAESPSDVEAGDPPCEVVIKYGFHRFGDGYDQFLSGMVWVFSDGRIITDTDRDGFLQWERRLTAEGVETLRSWAVEMLGRRVWVGADGAARTPIRYDGYNYFARDPGEFVRQLDDLSWLPASAWQSHEPVRYRPAWYRVCLEANAVDIDPAEVLAQMPPRAAQVLRGKPMTDRSDGDMSSLCTVIGSSGAERIVREYDEDFPSFDTYDISADNTPLYLTFSTLMPNGELGSHGD
jgi:hypothetical protein